MKIAVLGDTHFGMRGDSLWFHSYYKMFYEQVFFPYLVDNEITDVYQLGDLFDRRKYINFNSLHLARKYFFDRLHELGISFHTLLGNHDVSYKNTLEVNSSQLLLREYKNITIHDKPITCDVDETQIDIIPWICADNEQQVFDFIKNSTSDIVFGHFEIAGFQMDKNTTCHEGLDRDILKRYDVVLSGHFHHKSSDGQITYVGTPGEITWSDYNDPRGFHVFDTNTRELSFIRNPYSIFYKIEYDDTVHDFEYWNQFDFAKYKNVYVKLNVKLKQNPYLFDMVLDKLLKENPIDVSVVENFDDVLSEEKENIDESEDTMTILSKYIDQVSLNLDSDKMKVIMRDLYQECLSLDSTME
jgi:DNA repair exonuclease SbcCD nuclease subunit